MKLARSIVLLSALAAVSGCNSIGDGSTVVAIEIRDPGGRALTGPFPISQCLRDQLIAVAIFTDGTIADFSYRVTWASSDETRLGVSNNDINQVVVRSGAFDTVEGAPYRPGTLVPPATATPGTVTVTARFLGFADSQEVQLGTPTFRVRALKDIDPMPEPATAYLGPATFQRFGFFIEQADGLVLLPSALNVIGSLNPVLWSFADAENVFDPADSAVAGDFDKYAVPDIDAPTATISPGTGIVRGVTPEARTYTVKAVTSLCDSDPAFTATAPVQVAPFATTAPLTIEHEADFNGPGNALTGDLIAGTSELVTVLGHLDTDADGVGNETIDLGTQVDLRIAHPTTCDSGTTNCTCDSDGTGCTKRLLSNNGTLLLTLIQNDSAEASVQACFTDIDTTHADDCEEIDAGAGTALALESGVLDIHVIPVDLTGAGATLSIVPAAPAPEPAFTHPGRQFDAYGTFTALAGTPFNRDGTGVGTSATGTQKLTRGVNWLTRPQGSTTGFSDIGFVRNTHDGFFAPQGSFTYFKDVDADTQVDIYIAPLAPFTAVTPPSAPVPFTICPSAGC